MFRSAQSKLEESRVNLENLRDSQDTLAFKSAFNSFLASTRAITNALQKEGKLLDGFAEWYAGKQDEMRNDRLLRFIHDARTEDFHEGKHRLRFPLTEIHHFSTADAGEPPSGNSVISVGREGPFWIVDRGMANERRVPIKSGGSWSVRVSILGAPESHLGQELERNDPVTICALACRYFENLLFEATKRFRVGQNL